MSKVKEEFEKLKEKAKKHLDQNGKIFIQIGSATCEMAAGSQNVLKAFKKDIQTAKRDDIFLKQVGCTGKCSMEPIITVFMPNQKPAVYQKVDPEKAHRIFVSHFVEKTPFEDIEEIDQELSDVQELLKQYEMTGEFYHVYGKIPFYAPQVRMALRNSGIIEPLNIYEYVSHDGFMGLKTVLEKNDRDWVIAEVEKSKLRGRGGAGFPTGLKWKFAKKEKSPVKYMICNADEGDPGAFMDRSMLESDPFSVIEGMMIAGFAIGAKQGFFYIRAEYPLAVERIQKAIDICREQNLLGKNILGSSFDFDLEIRLGAGAFVCGEETALIHSIEGERGQPRIRPPYPASEGLWGKPTIINNVETLVNLPVIFTIGADQFSKIGTEKSGGTKAFALTGKVNWTGLVEVPMGTTVKTIVEDIGGGVPNQKKLKAVLTGGPAGGCIPAELMDTPIDYETLRNLGSIMGSGGMIVLDEDDCMVNVARYFMSFSQNESCGKCSTCREGSLRMLEILDRIIEGKGKIEDIDKLERLGNLMIRASLCGLGRAAPNPVLSTIRYFRNEFEAHIIDKKCPAKRCLSLVRYEIDPEKCIGCTACANVCPVSCISGERKKVHEIDQSKCIQCGRCLEICRFGAVKKV